MNVLVTLKNCNQGKTLYHSPTYATNTCIYYCEAKLSSYHLISNQECTYQYLDESLKQSKSTRCARSLGWGEKHNVPVYM